MLETLVARDRKQKFNNLQSVGAFSVVLDALSAHTVLPKTLLSPKCSQLPSRLCSSSTNINCFSSSSSLQALHHAIVHTALMALHRVQGSISKFRKHKTMCIRQASAQGLGQAQERNLNNTAAD